jgi:hypothetical protein
LLIRERLIRQGSTKTVKAEAFCKKYKESNIVRLKLKTFKSNNNVLNLII